MALLFTGVVGHARVDCKAQTVTVQLRDDALIYSQADAQCTVAVGSIDAAFAALQPVTAVTLVTPTNFLVNLPLTSKGMFSVKHLLSKRHYWLEFSFPGSATDASAVAIGTPIQVYAQVPCAGADA